VAGYARAFNGPIQSRHRGAPGAAENLAEALQLRDDPSLYRDMMDSRPDSMVRSMSQLPPAPKTAARGQLADTVLEELWFGDEEPDRPRYEASRSLAAAVARIEGLKPFPLAAQKLLHLLSDPGYRMADVQAVLETDPSLAARTLNVANSPLFRGLNPCRSIDQAIVRLGARNVRDLATGVAAMSMFADANAGGKRLRDHCVGVAAVVRILAEVALPGESSSLFLAGLMHDVGKLLLLQTGEMEYPENDEAQGEDAEIHLIERACLGYDHAVLGAHVMKLWRIPDPTPTLVAWHHQPARAFAQGGETCLMVSLLRAADQIEHGLARSTELDAAMCRRLGEDVGWTYADLEQGDLRELWPKMRDARRETLAALIG
jgi:HD-like signal output (HDOD) protein